MKKIIFIFVLLSICPVLWSQSVGIGTETPHASAALEVSSTTQGMLIPRMTSAQREMIANPAAGLLLFDITTNTFWFRDGSAWTELVAGGDTEVHRNGPNKIFMGLNDSVGIGTHEPVYKLHVQTTDEQYGIAHTTDEVTISTYTSNTTGGWIGTKSDHPFNVYAGDGFNQFTLLPNGNIGMGTTSPLYKLHVEGITLFDGYVGIGTGPFNKFDISHGSPRVEAHPFDLPLYVTGDLGSGSNGVEFRHSNGTQGIGFGFNTIYASGNNASQSLGLSAKGNEGHLLFTTNTVERMRITAAGKVGIGTGTPNGTLQFSNAVENRKVVLFEVQNNEHQFFGFGINQEGSLRYQVPISVNDHAFYTATSSTTSIELMRIRGNGRVGIGSSNPLASLDVIRGTAPEGTTRFQGTTHHSHFNFATTENTFIRGGKAGSHVLLNDLAGQGNVGVGTANPLHKFHVAGRAYVRDSLGIGTSTVGFPLSFPNTTGDKISLWGQSGNHFGFGVGPALLQIHSDGVNSDIAFGFGSSNSFFERMRIKGNGRVGINVTPVNQLDIHQGYITREGAHPSGLPLYVTGEMFPDSFGAEFRNYTSSEGIGIGYNTIYAAGSNSSQSIGLKAKGATGNVIFSTNGSERMRITADGYLKFAEAVFPVKKIALSEVASNDHQYTGFGSVAGFLTYQVPSTSGDHIFLAGTSSTTSSEVMRIKGNGTVDINGKLEIGLEIVYSGFVEVPGLGTGTATCSCPTNKFVVGGGHESNGNLTNVRTSYPNTQSSWRVDIHNSDLITYQFRAYAICARLSN